MQKAEQDSRFKFSSQYRLISPQDFQFVFAKPCKLVSQKLLVLYKLNRLSHARLGIMIGKQHVKLAVHRNRLRRIIRESFRHHKERLKGLDIIVLVRAKCVISSRKDVKKRIKSTDSLRNDLSKDPFSATIWREDINKLWVQLSDSSKCV